MWQILIMLYSINSYGWNSDEKTTAGDFRNILKRLKEYFEDNEIGMVETPPPFQLIRQMICRRAA